MSGKELKIKIDKSLIRTRYHNNKNNVYTVSKTPGNKDNTKWIIKSKSAKKIWSNSSTEKNILKIQNSNEAINMNWAKEIWDFIDDMKALQMSICKKDSNVNEWKRNFEKKKMSLYQEASAIYNSTKNNQVLSLSNSIGNINSNPTGGFLSPSGNSCYNRNKNNGNSSSNANSNGINNINNDGWFFSQSHSKSNINNMTSTSNVTSNTNITDIQNATNNNEQSVKVLTETLTSLRTTIDEINMNNKFIIDQLKTEIRALNDKLSKTSEVAWKYEKDSVKKMNSIKNIFKSVKEYNTTTTLDSLSNQSQGQSFSFQFQEDNNNNNNINNNINNNNKFEWYENEIKKAISTWILNFNTLKKANTKPMISKEGWNPKTKEQSKEWAELNKIKSIIKTSSKYIIKILKPYLTTEKMDIDFNIFDSDDNVAEADLENAIDNLKQYIKACVDILSKQKKEIEDWSKSVTEYKAKAESFKSALNSTVTTFTHNSIINSNYKYANDNQNNWFSDRENLKKMNTDLMNIQNDLLKKLEFKDIESEKKQEIINTLIQINNTANTGDINSIDVNSINNEKYRIWINWFNTEHDTLKQWKYDYFHLIQDFSRYIQNGEKIKINFASLNLENTNNNRKNNDDDDIEEEIDSEDLGKINENDLITDNNNRLNSKDSRGSNCNNINRFNKTAPINKTMEKVKHEWNQTKVDWDKVLKKWNDKNDILEAIHNALLKLWNEIQLSLKGKEIFTLLFRWLKVPENKIMYYLNEREKGKK